MTTDPTPEVTPPPAPSGRSWWPIPIYPVAFPLGIVVLLWGQSELNLLGLIRPALVAVVLSLVITFVLTLLAGDRRLGGIAATALLVGLIVDRVEASLLLAGVAVLVVVVARLPGGREIRFLPIATRILQLVATVAIVAAVIAVVGRPGFWPSIQEALLPPPGPADRPPAAAGAQDMFVYLIDGFPGATASAQAPWYDATAFPKALGDRGFTVHDDSRTNYLLTRLVIPTMFEGRHVVDIEGLAPPSGPDQAVDARRLRSVTEHAAGLAAIRAAGYDVVWVSSGYDHLDIRNVDRWIEAPGPSELEISIIRQTGVGSLLQFIDPTGFSEIMRDRIHAAYKTAEDIAAEPHTRPRFVFVHVVAPHPPTVFRADGSAENGSPDAAWDSFRGSDETTELRRQRSFEQVQAVADMTLEGVDAVRAASATPPVIVLFSDHATDIGWLPGNAMGSDLTERSASFLATLTPNRPELFGDKTMPINIIGTLTNAYLGTNVPMQPDDTYAYGASVLDVVPIEVTPGD
jgi:hypothetical protein